MRPTIVVLSFVLMSVFSLTVCCCADVVVLRNGGRLEGEVASRKDENGHEKDFVVRLRSGARIMLTDREVARVETVTPEEVEYRRQLNDLEDTAVAHWELSQWCEKNRLHAQKSFHLEHVLELDPDHELARRTLGFTKMDGQWMRQEDYLRSQGYEKYRGQWLLPQQIAILSTARDIELAQKQIRREMKIWRGWIGGRRHDDAIRNFEQLNDPIAAAGLIDLMAKEEDASVRGMYLEVLARLGNAGLNEFVTTAIYDEDSDLRMRAIELLNTDTRRSYAVQAFVPILRSDDNLYINRAAYALGQLGHTDAIWPLMHALVTEHVRIIQPQGDIRPVFGSGPNGGMQGLSAGQKPTKVVDKRENRSVLAALAKLTGENYQYVEPDWLNWYIRANTPVVVNLRRDN